MSLVKDECWADAQELGDGVELKSLSALSDFTRGTARHSVRGSMHYLSRLVSLRYPKTLRMRLLLGPLTCPIFAYAVFLILGGTEQQTALLTFALATMLGLLMSAIVVRQALQPLVDIVAAANRPELNSGIVRLPENGPREVRLVAQAFNAVSERLNQQVDERIQRLTAFSHDMQTPITRMRLRVELAEPFHEREKLLSDLSEAERLVRDGINYARNSHVTCEYETRVELRSFVESVVFDYQDTGRDVVIIGNIQGVHAVKPAALRRILSNFIDNSLKYCGSAQVQVSRGRDGRMRIAVMDRGPGIDPTMLGSVMKPFVRLPQRTDERVSGVGLGLAIAQQLACEMGASLLLENREGGGLSAQIILCGDQYGGLKHPKHRDRPAFETLRYETAVIQNFPDT
jgi:signal transduction histidine kinase